MDPTSKIFPTLHFSTIQPYIPRIFSDHDIMILQNDYSAYIYPYSNASAII